MGLTKNKKGIAFFGFVSIFLIIIFLFLFFSYKVPNENITKILNNYNKDLVQLDTIKQEITIYNIYKEDIINRLQKRLYTKISNLEFISSIVRFARGSYLDNKGCKIRTKKGGLVYLWLDERNTKLDYCKIKIDDTFNEKIKNILLKEKNIYDLNSNFKYDVKFDKKRNDFNLIFKNNIQSNGNYMSFKLNSDKVYIENLQDLKEILNDLSFSISKLSSNNVEFVPNCLNSIETQKIKNKLSYCIEKNLKLIIFNKDKTILNKFDLNLSIIENTKISNKFFPLKIILKNKKNNQELRLGIVLKNNLPESLVSFSVSKYDFLDKTIDLSIEKPKFYSKNIKGFIILYSYNNFFDNSNTISNSISNTNSNKLKKILNSGKVPSEIKLTSLKRNSNVDFLNKNVKYRIFNDLDINLLDVEDSTFDTKTNKKDILIFQSFNFKTKKFEKLKEQKLYFYVFAYTKSQSYFISKNLGNIRNTMNNDGLGINVNNNNNNNNNKLIKSIIPENSFSLKPLINDVGNKNSKSLTISGSGNNLEKSIIIKIPKGFYDDVNFYKYDIYLFKGGLNSIYNNIIYSCDNSINNNRNNNLNSNTLNSNNLNSNINYDSNNCIYLNGNDFNLKDRNLDLILTSSSKTKDNFPNKKIINIGGKFSLENNKNYDLLIVPTSLNGKGIINSEFWKYQLFSKNNDFYNIVFGEGLKKPKIFKNILVENKLNLINSNLNVNN